MTDQANSTQYMGTPEKLTAAMLQGLNNLPEGLQKGFQEQLQSLKDPKTQAVLGSVVAAWGALHLVGVGEAADLGLLGLGYAALGNDALTATKELASFVQAVNEAQVSQNLFQPAQQQKLAEASKHFEKFVEIVGVDGVALLVGAKAGEVSTKLSNTLKENAAKLSQLPAEAGRLLNAAQEQLSGLTKGLRESAEGGWNKLAEGLDELLGRKPVTPEGVNAGPLKMEGRGPSESGSAWISKAVEGIKNTHGEKVAQLVEESLDKLVSLLGAEGANRAAQSLETLSTKLIPELAEKLATLQRHIGEEQLGSVQAEKLSSDINKSLNSIKDHLKPDDLVGALRDNVNEPVSRWRPGQAPKIYDHNKEVSTGVKSLTILADEANKALQWHGTPASVKGELSELSTYINSVIERVEKFRTPATHQALIQQSNPTVVAQQIAEKSEQQKDRTIAQQTPAVAEPTAKLVSYSALDSTSPLSKIYPASQITQTAVNNDPQLKSALTAAIGYEKLIRAQGDDNTQFQDYRYTASVDPQTDKVTVSDRERGTLIEHDPHVSVSILQPLTAQDSQRFETMRTQLKQGQTIAQSAPPNAAQRHVENIAPLSTSQLKQLSPGELLKAVNTVQQWQKSEPELPSPAQQQKMMKDFDSLKNRVAELKTEYQTNKQTYEQVDKRGVRSLLNPFGVSQNEYDCASRDCRVTNETLERTQEWFQEAKSGVKQVNQQQIAQERWSTHPFTQTVATLSEKLKSPAIQPHVEQLQTEARSLQQWEKAAVALGRPESYVGKIKEIQSEYGQGKGVSPTAVEMLDRDMGQHQQQQQAIAQNQKAADGGYALG
jgi:hypothetical protein